jgi:hypothetical protein
MRLFLLPLPKLPKPGKVLQKQGFSDTEVFKS